MDLRLYQDKEIRINLERFPNPTDGRLTNYNGIFAFKPIELISTAGRLLFPLQKNTYQEYINNGLCLLSSLNLDTSSITCININDPDQKRRIAETMGVGLGALFMQKTFNLDWETIIQIPGQSSRADYQANNNLNENFIFECKGTFDQNHQNTQIKHGVRQKVQHIANFRIVLSSFLSSINNNSLLRVVDPFSKKENKIKDYEFFVLRYYTRLCNFAGFNILGRRLYFEYQNKLKYYTSLHKGKHIPFEEKPFLESEKKYIKSDKEKSYKEIIDNFEYRGRFVSKGKVNSFFDKVKKNWKVNKQNINHNFFFGLRNDVLLNLENGNYRYLKDKKINVKSKIIENKNELYIVFSDGSIFGIMDK